MVAARWGAAGALGCLLAAGLWALAGPSEDPVPPVVAAPLADVEGRILVPVAAGAGTPHGCAKVDGVLGWTIPAVTPGAVYTLVATGATAEEQDFDVEFERSRPNCQAGTDPTADQPSGAWGDEAGIVPPDAASAIVYLASGAAGTFRYREFPPLDPPTVALEVVDTMHFRQVQVQGAYSAYFDMFEPHMAVSGTGAIYVTGHAMASDVSRSPAFVSVNDGATWAELPDPAPLPPATAALPVLGGRIGQGNEGGLAADEAGRAWLYDAAWIAGTAPLYGWCDDGARSCAFEPEVMDREALLLQPCPTEVRTLDRPWARAAGGKVLLSNLGLRTAVVDESRAVTMLGLYEPASGAARWNTCVGVGGMGGVPALRASDGLIAMPQVMRTPDGQGWLRVHHGTDPLDLALSPPVLRMPSSWQLCQHFGSYSDFDAAGTFHVFAGLAPRTVAVAVSRDLATFATLTFDPGGYVKYMWLEGSKTGEGALITWAAAPDCDDYSPSTFYAGHVVLEQGQAVLRDVSRVVEGVTGTCGHYMGNDLGPDGRGYLIVHASPGACLGAQPYFLPETHIPWTLYVQDAGPVL